jgi:DNA-binding beta-propeller fold protein YncE
LIVNAGCFAADYAAPAGNRFPVRRPGAASILPGGRVIAPHGRQYVTGPGAFGLAVSANGRIVVTANGGPQRYSVTALRRDNQGRWATEHIVARGGPEGEEDAWRSVFMGLAFTGRNTVVASEGNSGRIRRVNASDGSSRDFVDLNQNGESDSYTGDLAYDEKRKVLYAVDQANFRMVAIDASRRRIVGSVQVGRMPFAIALSPDGRKAYVTNVGMFEYRPVPGLDPENPRATGLPFPAFGFPSQEALAGAERDTERGSVEVPGLGDPNVPGSNSLAVIDVANPSAPRVEVFIRTGLPFGEKSLGGSSPSGVVAGGGRVFVSNAHNDSITVIDATRNEIVGEIPLRVPGFERLRGVLPVGMAYHEASGWLLVAEAGINAVGVIDTRAMQVIGHLPTPWFPSRVALHEDTVLVSSAKGFGVGPNAVRGGADDSFIGTLRRGSVSMFPLPAREELPNHTATVLHANGFRPSPQPAHPVPASLRYAVLIVKENRTFDEVLGDVVQASNGAVQAIPALARFGSRGYASGRGERFSLQDVNVTPNHHEMVRRWSFSDNFHADSEVSVDGHHWLVGSYPNAWTETSLMAAYGGQKDFRYPTGAPGRLLFPGSNSSVHPEEQLEAGAIWHHFERHGITFRNYGEGFELAGAYEGPGLEPTGGRFLTNVPMPDPLYRNTSRTYPMYNMNIPDQYRAAQFINEINERHLSGKEPFPRFIYIHLPNDHMADPRPDDGYPYAASYVADNDYALGRIIEFLSNTPWWREMAVFVTEDDAQGGRDHVDAHRTVLLTAGPYFKRNYVSHVNSSFPGLLKTIFRILGVPPLNLFDAVASDLADCFTSEPDFTAYEAIRPDTRLFEPDEVKDPLDPRPGPKMDDPSFLRDQHNSR